MSNLSFAKVEISKTRGGFKIKTSNITSCRGCDQFARDLAVKLGIKTFTVESGSNWTTLIVTAAWINGEYVEKAYFDIFYDYEEKCFYALQDM
ncbi:hypothetical protein PIJPGVCJ_CDS0185 [Escherichia phage MIZ5]|uniref:Uncharacterized protein n=1 Tax=Escherichia phage Phi1 TaxID=448384 RepID=A7XF20_9CAUD|nr:hypothetical protein phi1p070 [Escherichia phage Phi1]QZI93918.1 hypothetical protein HFGIMCCB_00069 [Enterobacteria phage Whisky]WNA14982.1 hypothetical protein XCVQDTFY_CDS0185 [Krischvirus RB49]WQN06397.1 hypothetical protein [Escherichia phage vB-Eco-KMB43]HCN7862669.1 hypothetical protein [Escherichia coli]ABR24579.1 hypothetical protein phi1p070 [Escherichia phage Phi1]